MRKEINIRDIVVEEVQKQMKHFINENYQIINEKWSISDDVQNAMEKILSDVKNAMYRNGECTTLLKRQLYLYRGTIDNYILLRNYNITLYYYVYNCSNEQYCNYVYNEADHIDGFVEETNELYLTLYMVNNEWNEELSEKNVVHELEHILQASNSKLNNKKYKVLMNACYNFANDILQHQGCHNQYEITLAKLFYYTNSHEQDAFLQEYARKLEYNAGCLFTKDSEMHKILNNLKGYYSEFINNKDAFKETIKDYRSFGYTFGTMSKMFSRQIQRLEKKMQKVEIKFRSKLI